MAVFDIYLKKGRSFSLTFERFEHRDNNFSIYESANQQTSEGFLLFDAVAAIVPQIQPRSNEIEGYRVYLKNDQHVDIHAHAFDDKHPSVKFYVRLSDAGEPREVKNVYVATSEVIAITPVQGFRIGRSQSLED